MIEPNTHIAQFSQLSEINDDRKIVFSHLLTQFSDKHVLHREHVFQREKCELKLLFSC
jgi:hypothetical protein